MTKTIMILAITAVFVAGTLTTGTLTLAQGPPPGTPSGPPSGTPSGPIATDVNCTTPCIDEVELTFDTANQAELDTHTANAAAHHGRYTDAEAVTAVGPHTALPTQTDIEGLGFVTGAHTSRYTNAEAVTAVGPHTPNTDTDPFNELNTSFSLSGTILSLIDAGGTLAVDLSSLVAAATDLICNGCVDSTDIATNAVGSFELALDSVNTGHISAGAVTFTDIANDAIGTLQIINGAIQAADTNINSVQVRVGQSCPPGNSIRAISAFGQVTCEKDSRGFSSFFFTASKFAGVADGGTDTVDLGSATDRFCALTKVHFRDIDSQFEDAICQVKIDTGSNRWELTAFADDDADAFCRAQCLRFTSDN